MSTAGRNKRIAIIQKYFLLSGWNVRVKISLKTINNNPTLMITPTSARGRKTARLLMAGTMESSPVITIIKRRANMEKAFSIGFM